MGLRCPGTAGPQLEIALAHNPSLVVNAVGPSSQFMIDQVKEAGRSRRFSWKSPTRRATCQRRRDLIIAQGYEAGGHTGEIGSMV